MILKRKRQVRLLEVFDNNTSNELLLRAFNNYALFTC